MDKKFITTRKNAPVKSSEIKEQQLTSNLQEEVVEEVITPCNNNIAEVFTGIPFKIPYQTIEMMAAVITHLCPVPSKAEIRMCLELGMPAVTEADDIRLRCGNTDNEVHIGKRIQYNFQYSQTYLDICFKGFDRWDNMFFNPAITDEMRINMLVNHIGSYLENNRRYRIYRKSYDNSDSLYNIELAIRSERRREV
jgi:hypothetical protein